MNVALRHSPSPNRALPAAAGRLSRVAIFDDLAAVEPLWRGLEAQDCLTTPFQRYDFLGPWQRHVGARAGVLPFIVVGFDALGETICLWPLGRRQAGPLRVVEFLGGKHASFNLPIWRRETAAGATKAMLDAIVAQLGSSADALILRNQPRAWDGIANPIALLPHQPSPDAVHSGKLLPDFEALAREQISSAKRKKIRNRERQLLTHGPVRFWRAQTQAQAHELLAVFHAQKARRMQELGIANVFDEPGVHEFIAEALTSGIASNPAIEFYGLAAGDTTVATWAGVAGGGRFSGTFTSFIHNEIATASPGQILLMRLVQDCCKRGLATFDLGVGDAGYKEMFCKDVEPLIDSFLPLNSSGRLAVFAAQAAFRVKRAIKRNPALWSMVTAVRRLRGRLSSGK